MHRLWLLTATSFGCLNLPLGMILAQPAETPHAPPGSILAIPPQPHASPQGQFQSTNASVIRAPTFTITIAPSPSTGQPVLINYTLTNPGPVAVTGTVRGRIGGRVLTNAAGGAPGPVTISSGDTISGAFQLTTNTPLSGTVQLSFVREGECHDRPGPYGQPIKVCNDQLLASANEPVTVSAPPPAPAEPTYEEIAGHWAPLLSHDVDTNWGDRFWGDYITTANFDGDWNSSNNWDNLLHHPLPAKVYYWVNETPTHWYLGYAFFHPRDWSNANVDDGKMAHNNDVEAVALQIRRTPGHRFGQFLAMVTVAHTDFYSYTDTDTPADSPWFATLSLSPAVRGRAPETIDADVDFVADDRGLHPVVYIEAEGHGVYGHPRNGFGVTDWAPLDRDSVTDWRGGSWTGIVVPPKSGQPGVPADRNGWGDGVIFHFENVADDPTADRNNAPTHFEVVGYALEDVSSLWRRRNCEETFNESGQFPGGANPPWHLNDGNDNVEEDGAIFNQPAILFSSYFEGSEIGDANPTYTGRSFTLASGPCGN